MICAMNKLISNISTKKHKLRLAGLLALTFVILFGVFILAWSFQSKKEKVHEQVVDPHVREENQRVFEIAFHLSPSEPDSARLLLSQRLEIIKTYGDVQEMLSFNNLIGVSHIFQDQYNHALRYFYENLELTTGQNDSIYIVYKGRAYQNIGVVNLLTNKYKDAVDFFLKAISMFDVIDDILHKAIAQNNLGHVYLEINDLEKAMSYFEAAYESFNDVNYLPGLAASSNHKAQYFNLRHDTDSAMNYFNLAIDYASQANHSYGLSNIYLEKGNFYLEKGLHQEAITCFRNSEYHAVIIESDKQSSLAKLGIARTYLALNDLEQSMNYANQAAQIAAATSNASLEYMTQEVLSKIHEAMGDIAKAYEYYQRAADNKARLYGEIEIYQLYNLEVEELSRQMELKNLEVAKQQLQLSKRQNQMILLFVVSLSLIIIISLSYYFVINKIRHKQKERLHESKMKHSQEKNLAVIQAEINERKRLGSELHDGIGALLSLTKLHLSSLNDKDSVDAGRQNIVVQKTINNIDEVIKEVKNISQSMTPLTLTEKGFKEAVKELLGQLTKYKVDLSINGLNGRLESYVEHALYRTIQEAINNIVKHAECTEVNVQILQSNKEISVMIEDNGKGFDAGQAVNHKGLGLKNAASRIEGLNGQFFVDSMPGRGTIVTISIPSWEK